MIKHHCNFYAEVGNHVLLVYFKDEIDTSIVFYLAHTLLKSRLFVMNWGDTAKKKKKKRMEKDELKVCSRCQMLRMSGGGSSGGHCVVTVRDVLGA